MMCLSICSSSPVVSVFASDSVNPLKFWVVPVGETMNSQDLPQGEFREESHGGRWECKLPTQVEVRKHQAHLSPLGADHGSHCWREKRMQSRESTSHALPV